MSVQEAFLGPNPGAGLAAGVLLVNLGLAVVVAAVGVARVVVRRTMGPALAYGLWRIVPLFALVAALLTFIPADADFVSLAGRIGARAPWLAGLLPLWAAGACGLALVFAVAQHRFMRAVAAGRGGPAVVGLIAPRIVLPADDGRYTAQERELIRAHERAHVARKDPRGAAHAAFFQCVSWFNPAAHLAAYLLRLDQELACDAAVILRNPGARGAYARALLKTQLARAPLPLGCYWPARSQHPLEVRISALKRRDGAPVGGIGASAAPVEPIRP